MIFSHFHGKKAGSEFIPSGSPFAWWKADSLSLNDNDQVATWADSSGNGKDLLQPDGSYKPTYKVNQQGVLPGVSFDGTENMSVDFGSSDGDKHTIFIVFKLPSFSGSNMFLFEGLDGNNRNLFYTAATGTNWFMYQGNILDSGDANDTNIHYMTLYFSGADADSTMRLDGSLILAPGDAGDHPLVGLNIAAGVNGDSDTNKSIIDLYEFIVYTGEENPVANEAGLAAKWGI
jgi:hypothetical protein